MPSFYPPPACMRARVPACDCVPACLRPPPPKYSNPPGPTPPPSPKYAKKHIKNMAGILFRETPGLLGGVGVGRGGVWSPACPHTRATGKNPHHLSLWIFRLGSFAWELSLGRLLGSLRLGRSLGNLRWDLFAWEFSFGSCRLGTFAWDFCLGACAWRLEAFASGQKPLNFHGVPFSDKSDVFMDNPRIIHG